jgi:glucokinase
VALGFGAEFFAAAQAELDARCRLDFSRGTRIVPAGLGDEGPLVGAAAVARLGLGAPIGGLRRADPSDRSR